MNIASAIVVYVLVWWLVFFALLPVGVRSRWEDTPDDVAGADPGAPSDPQLKKKALRATWLAALISVVVIGFILSGILDFRDR